MGSKQTGRVAAPVRVGLLGLGTVGQGVAHILQEHGEMIAERTGIELQVVRALVRNPRAKRGKAAARIPTTTDAEAIVHADDVDIVCELLGGIEPACGLISSALEAKKPVVTANKAVMAKFGTALFKEAAAAGRGLYFEAAVAGGIPIIRTLKEGLASDRITQITGILNGTTNFILAAMEGGQDYASALRQAQEAGYAEADPTLDVNGRDAADKLAILLQLAFGLLADPEKLPVEGISALHPDVFADALELGYRVKLLAIGRRSGAQADGKERIDARVHPALVPVGHPLSTVPAAQNAILVGSDSLGTTLYQGPGAGSLPTGSAVVADIIEAARDLRANVEPKLQSASAKQRVVIQRPELARSAFYLRLRVADEPGVLAAITKVLSRHDISLSTVLQRERGSHVRRDVPITLITHDTTFGAMQKALAQVRREKALLGDLQVMPIEAHES